MAEERIHYFFVTVQDDGRCSVGTIVLRPKDPRQDLGTITHEQLQAGWDFPGSLLRVQLIGGQITLMWDGQSLPQIPAPTSELVDKKTLSKANMASGATGAIGCFTLIGALLGAKAGDSPLQTAIWIILSIISFVLAYFIARYSAIALVTIITFYSIDAIALITKPFIQLNSMETLRLTFVAISVHILFLTWMIRGLGPLIKVRKAMQREKVRFASVTQNMTL
jgi:hypothetical protein